MCDVLSLAFILHCHRIKISCIFPEFLASNYNCTFLKKSTLGLVKYISIKKILRSYLKMTLQGPICIL